MRSDAAVAPTDASFPVFRPRAPWWGGDLQTLRNTLRPPRAPLADEGERLLLPMDDGSGDRLAARLHRVPDARRPLAVLIHGLSGSEESAYLTTSAAALLRRGHPVLRLNLRGAGASRPHCRWQYHAGRSTDLRDALRALEPALLGGGVCLVGYSLGGNMLLKFLAEYGAGLPIVAAVAVSAPIDLAAASRRILMRRNRVYHRHLLHYMKLEALAAPELSPDDAARIRAAASIWEFDDHFVAPRNGWSGAAEYYAVNSARGFLDAIRAPTLVVHALDDPWIPADAYASYDWSRNPHLVPLLAPGGGHVGFHARDSAEPWHDRCIGQFFAAR